MHWWGVNKGSKESFTKFPKIASTYNGKSVYSNTISRYQFHWKALKQELQRHWLAEIIQSSTKQLTELDSIVYKIQ
jgi:hypothetical protein